MITFGVDVESCFIMTGLGPCNLGKPQVKVKKEDI